MGNQLAHPSSSLDGVKEEIHTCVEQSDGNTRVILEGDFEIYQTHSQACESDCIKHRRGELFCLLILKQEIIVLKNLLQG